MNSLYSQLTYYTVQLNLINTQGWKFNSDFRASPVSTNPAKSIDVLEKISSCLKEAPILFANGELGMIFFKALSSYTAKVPKVEQQAAKNLESKIKKIIETRFKHVKSCFQGNSAKSLNLIMDKKPEDMNEKDYKLLYDLSNYFAFKRKEHQIFFQDVAVIEAIRNIRKKSPEIIITFGRDGAWNPAVQYQIPDDPLDLQFLIFLEFHYHNHPDLLYIDKDILKKVLERRLESKDSSFQKYLNQYLSLHAIAAHCREWDNTDNERKLFEQLDATLPRDSENLNSYSVEFMHQPSDYTNIAFENRSAFGNSNTPYEKIADSLKDYDSDTNTVFDDLYKMMYEKIKSYQKIHSSALLPLVDPSSYKTSKKFVTQEDLDISLLKEISNLEKEIKVSQTKRELIVAKPTAVKKEVDSTSSDARRQLKKRLKLENKNNQKKIVTEDSKLLEPISLNEEDKKEEIKPENTTGITIPSPDFNQNKPVELRVGNTESVSSSNTKLENVMIRGQEAPNPLIAPSVPSIEKSLRELLVESSPFKVDSRITNWFISDIENPILNEESQLFHNFAWATNDILWQFGLRYPRPHEKGYYQPAIAMLCKVFHHNYPNPELFLITMTFTQQLVNGHLSNNGSTYDPSWVCYHRTLTRRPQNVDLISEYVANGKREFIDFPSLPSQRLHINLPENLKGKTYPDGSYIQSIQGESLIIRDPKNDSDKTPCRLHLFIVKSC